jgi:uncharacterized membrane protein
LIAADPPRPEDSAIPQLSLPRKPAPMRTDCWMSKASESELFEEKPLVEEIIPLLSRWVHVGTAIVLVGGSVFMRFVLAPAATATLPDAEHAALRERVLATWKLFVHIGVLLFILSGFYNYLVVTLPKHKGDSLYNALMGIKILLAFGVFFIAEALVGKSAGLKKIREKRNTWLMIAVLLSAVIVGIAGFLKVRTWEPKTEPAVSVSRATQVLG